MRLIPLLANFNGMRAHLATCRPALVRLATLWCHDGALAQDLAQEALAKALAHADQLRDPDKLRPWLYGILANCWRDHLRALRPTEDIDTIEEHWLATADTAELAASRTQLGARVRAAVGRLPVGQRLVLALVDLEECSYAEVAQILTIPIGTVMSRLCRARAAMRAALADTQLEHQALRSVK